MKYIIAAAVILGGFFFYSYNTLVTLQTEVEEGRSNLSVQLERKAALIPNLVKTVKSFAKHEDKIFEEINSAKKTLTDAKSIGDMSAANEAMNGMISRLNVYAEKYPEIKSDKVYTGLMDELAGTENRIAFVREKYNKTVKEYNATIKKIPTKFIAERMGMEQADFFAGSEKSQKAQDLEIDLD